MKHSDSDLIGESADRALASTGEGAGSCLPSVGELRRDWMPSMRKRVARLGLRWRWSRSERDSLLGEGLLALLAIVETDSMRGESGGDWLRMRSDRETRELGDSWKRWERVFLGLGLMGWGVTTSSSGWTKQGVLTDWKEGGMNAQLPIWTSCAGVTWDCCISPQESDVDLVPGMGRRCRLERSTDNGCCESRSELKLLEREEDDRTGEFSGDL